LALDPFRLSMTLETRGPGASVVFLSALVVIGAVVLVAARCGPSERGAEPSGPGLTPVRPVPIGQQGEEPLQNLDGNPGETAEIREREPGFS